mmetsp:Transcript_24814/g.68710  ORF Transcript_24814/g.68710 Transcript_24814/m.68710 type:complete len:172 (-) Transcript_24814:248-763(-)|eukprot:CAMPEP_0168728442 /NCGR_PEP_ID=MMETSP0724-20121128/5685_1 /TAXON_ID=265536 /ORGANISM="Amphiprora sp., Strain CCMP467" /LENGTH=171 /DNA_ID=CAMNT_0008775285 /DNA_START=191 /DNA_END=706 /DNA_ORIENTATION=-
MTNQDDKEETGESPRGEPPKLFERIMGWCHLALASTLIYFLIQELVTRNEQWGWWMTLYVLGILHGLLGFLHSRCPLWECGATLMFAWACAKIVYSAVFLAASLYNRQQESDILDTEAFEGKNQDVAGSAVSLATGVVGFVIFDGFGRICGCGRRRKSSGKNGDDDEEMAQ